jgi:hypothetical protein
MEVATLPKATDDADGGDAAAATGVTGGVFVPCARCAVDGMGTEGVDATIAERGEICGYFGGVLVPLDDGIDRVGVVVDVDVEELDEGEKDDDDGNGEDGEDDGDGDGDNSTNSS